MSKSLRFSFLFFLPHDNQTPLRWPVSLGGKYILQLRTQEESDLVCIRQRCAKRLLDHHSLTI
jgi:hypothetical protein